MLPLSEEMLEAAYEYLRTTPPFNKWNLPDGEDIRFHVVRARDCFAKYQRDGDLHHISVSISSVAHSDTLIEKMAHEMVHLHLELTGSESKSKSPSIHNAAFRKYATRICQIHGWDPKGFY